MKLKINSNKNIGSVIYVVEGDADEVSIIKRIFSGVFKYTVVKYDKTKNSYKLIKSENKYSKVFIVPAKQSAIVKLDKSNDYFDEIYSRLSLDYELDLENSAIYYLFDRDRESNNLKQILPLMDKYGNSRDNGFEMNGLLLLSYPCIQSFYTNCKNDDVYLTDGKQVKMYTSSMASKPILLSHLKSGANLLLSIIKDELNICIKELKVDSFSKQNKELLFYEEDLYKEKHKYRALSTLFISLVDLGILEFEE